MKVRPRRSVLYMPGANQRALDKARTLAADSLILDLEDSVAPESKVQARDNVCTAVKSHGYGSRELVIRVNALETPWGTADLFAAAAAGPDAILMPKVSHPGDIVSAAKVLKAAGASDRVRLWAMIETPMAIVNMREIAATGSDPDNRMSCVVLGTNDLLKESRARMSHDRFAVVPWLALTLVAARAYGLDVIDGVYNEFRDDVGFRAECEHGRTLGMDGKTLIHPSQVGPCNDIFSPTADEVAWSRKIIDAFKLPANLRAGVITLDGRMVERLHLVMAQRTVAIAEAIGEMSLADGDEGRS
jgi:citrate lyase subunit beta / citryl-CoA lyase